MLWSRFFSSLFSTACAADNLRSILGFCIEGNRNTGDRLGRGHILYFGSIRERDAYFSVCHFLLDFFGYSDVHQANVSKRYVAVGDVGMRPGTLEEWPQAVRFLFKVNTLRGFGRTRMGEKRSVR